MTTDDKLAAAAATIASMPDATITQRLERLEAEHRRRSDLTGARHSAELDSIDLDWAAYQLARQHESAGDLTAAARWYRMAAANDFADAALRLGGVLDVLSCQRAASTQASCHVSQREELALVSEAARWYADAYGAGHPEAAGRLDAMIGHHDTRRAHAATPATGPAPPAGRVPPGCRPGGLDAVLGDSDLATATTHFGRCTACQREFLSRGGLLPSRRPAHAGTAPHLPSGRPAPRPNRPDQAPASPHAGHPAGRV